MIEAVNKLMTVNSSAANLAAERMLLLRRIKERSKLKLWR